MKQLDGTTRIKKLEKQAKMADAKQKALLARVESLHDKITKVEALVKYPRVTVVQPSKHALRGMYPPTTDLRAVPPPQLWQPRGLDKLQELQPKISYETTEHGQMKQFFVDRHGQKD